LKKMAGLLLIIFALSNAQFEMDEKALSTCQQMCCINANGTYADAPATCSEPEDPLEHSSCNNRCLERFSHSVAQMSPDGGACCAPAFAMLGLASCAFACEAGCMARGKFGKRK
jgi:hypothetical protein